MTHCQHIRIHTLAHMSYYLFLIISLPFIERRSEQNRLISWVKQVNFSPKLNQRRQLNMINELILSSSGRNLADELGKSSGGTSTVHGGGKASEQHSDGKTNISPKEMKNGIVVLMQEGLDLILNVLNNAITLHRRVSGSKHSCTPSKR